jgi:hypothetical protein
MNRLRPVLGVCVASVAAAGGGVLAVRARRRVQRHESGDTWLTVTVNRPPDEVLPQGRPPAPLDVYGDQLEVRVHPAPGDRGTELAARRRNGGPGDTMDLRRDLREAKSLLEAGEVMLPDAPPTTHPTPLGKILGAVDRRAQKEGVL